MIGKVCETHVEKEVEGGKLMTKTVLPEDVAHALECVKSTSCSTKRLIEIMMNGGVAPNSNILKRYSENNFENLLNALVNGYEVEPKEYTEIRKYFNNVINSRDKEGYQVHKPNADYFHGVEIGIQSTLSMLSKVVNGVNDK